MKTSVIVGVGQLGGVFAHALLKRGHRVVPIRRSDSISEIAGQVEPDVVLVAVGEGDLAAVLPQVPKEWRDRVALIQNELLPGSWSALGEASPTVGVIWFEKKAPIAPHVIQSSPFAGCRAATLVDALSTLDIAAHEISFEELTAALVLKNLYILTANVAGRGAPPKTTTGQLWQEDNARTLGIARDVLTLQRGLLSKSGHGAAAEGLEEEALLRQLGETLMADPDHGACGRSAPARHARALALAAELNLRLDALSGAAIHGDG